MIQKLIDQVLSDLPERSKQILSFRLGLEGGFNQTLEAIGSQMKITRERVRQLENSGLKQVQKTALKLKDLENFFKLVEDHLGHFKGIREEKRLLKELSYLLNEDEVNHLKVRFLVFLDRKLTYFPENSDHLGFWASDKKFAQKVIEFIKKLNRAIGSKKSPLAVEAFEKFVNDLAKSSGLNGISSGVLMSFVSLSHNIAFSPFGYIGTENHLAIAPANVGEKAYLVLQQNKQPMHFRDLAKSMNDYAKTASSFHPAWQKTTEAQTVHNELIKHKNFVLVGRGIYALSEWGYQKGTVKEVIAAILKKSKRPLTYQEIVTKVLEHRMVKTSTIFINLQNKKYFLKDKNKRYSLRPIKGKVEEA